MSVLALIPARSGSKGAPRKSWRLLGDRTLIHHAAKCALDAGVPDVVVTTDDTGGACGFTIDEAMVQILKRPAELAQDDTPMIAVVQHALQQIPGRPDDIILLVQPTQPLRRPAHLREAVKLLQESKADSVVSVVPLPLTHSPELVCVIRESGRIVPYLGQRNTDWALRRTRRQDAQPVYRPDGTVYAFRRQTVSTHGHIYGRDVRPFLIDPADSCELDDESQWADVVRRWEARGRD